jgi:hypothetical protein
MKSRICLSLFGFWVSPCNRSDPSDVDALAVKAMALTINAGHFNANGCKRCDHQRLGFGA